MRRLFVSSFNLAHCLPLFTRFTGTRFSDPASLLPPQSPPVFYAETLGKTPFRFHLDVGDVGHQVILGPTGSGKSTYLGFLIAQFLRYENAHVVVFDKDESHKALTLALGGGYHDLGDTETLAFCPLSDLSTDSQKMRASQFIEDLVFLQHVTITPEMRSSIYAAIDALAQQEESHNRNLTVFQATVQHETVRKALQYYTLAGQMKLLDATEANCQLQRLHTFEMRWLLAQKPDIYLPVLRTIFDQIEARLEASHGKCPTLIVLEEAWLYIGHEVFARKIKDWLKTLRKHNARVIFATQSLADLYDPSTQSLTQTTAAILESCPTKVYLPHPSMDSEMKTLYRKMGLSDRHIDIIQQEAQPKRDYFVSTPEGHALINLGFDPPHHLPLAFVGLSRSKSQDLLHYQAHYPKTWITEWLNVHGFSDWATVWQNTFAEENEKKTENQIQEAQEEQKLKSKKKTAEEIPCATSCN